MLASKPDSAAIFSVNNEQNFKELTLEVFHYQYHNNKLYQRYCDLLHRSPDRVNQLEDIPFLPVAFFKTHRVVTGADASQLVFQSSGTTGSLTSYHHVTDPGLYEQSFSLGFNLFYGSPENYCILALLPSYIERGGSSLVYMAQHLIQQSRHPLSGFYLNDSDGLLKTLNHLRERKQATLLLGVTYALLDLASTQPIPFPELIIMETGGMKGRRKEMVREEVHQILSEAFQLQSIHSEYGMTELLSQAYSKGNGRFFCPPWMKVLIRDTNDPLSAVLEGKTGGINVIDLANVNSCSFLQIQDLGKLHSDGSFEVSGRFDHSQIRGCNLLVQ